jgi:sigma-B regulation protein RsbU (phosphoserine phosphatase)
MGPGALAVGVDSRSIRHSIRTLLNHIAGYADILRQESHDCRENALCESYGRIRTAAIELRDASLEYFSDQPQAGLSLEAPPALERRIYGLLYDIIGLVQTLKRGFSEGQEERFLPDTEKILGAANGIVEIFELHLESNPAIVVEGENPSSSAYLEAVDLPPASRKASILVVDDSEPNRSMLARHLERQGHEVSQAADGVEGLAALKRSSFDILIVDVMMPGMNGHQLLERVKADPALKAVDVIVISSIDDSRTIARCIELGAEDFLPRDFEPIILRARIEACLERRSLRAKEELYLRAVHETARLLDEGLSEGAEYVRGLLPPRLKRPGLSSDWLFIPSRALGGDVFGYHPLSSRRMAIFLLDVSGHGIGAALYSVTLMNLLKNQALAGTDFSDPASVLRRLNESFQMESQNNLYFTAWYGVWDERRDELTWSSAGGPPAVLLLPDGRVERLSGSGMAVGLDLSAEYSNGTVSLPRGGRLYLFSDGIYEVRTKEGPVLGLDAFINILTGLSGSSCSRGLATVADMVQGLARRGRFEDDVSLVEVNLGKDD